jgi:hypothetical protein
MESTGVTCIYECSTQTRGPTGKLFDVAEVGIWREWAFQRPTLAFDRRIESFGVILRVDGQFGEFGGDDVGEVRFGRGRVYASVDIVLRKHDWMDRTVQQIAEVFVSRTRAIPDVIEPVFARRKVCLDASVLRREIGEWCEWMEIEARRFDPWAKWVYPKDRVNPEWVSDPPPRPRG